VQVYSDLTVDYFKMFLLNVPAAVVALTLCVQTQKKNVSDTIKYVFIIVQAQPEWGWIGSG